MNTREVNWNLTGLAMYPGGTSQQKELHPLAHRMHGLKLNGVRPIVISVPKNMYNQLYKGNDYALHPKVDRNNILTHTADGPDMDRINNIVYPNDNQLY